MFFSCYLELRKTKIIFFQVWKFIREKPQLQIPVYVLLLGVSLCISAMSEAVIEVNVMSIHEGFVKLDN